jgi:hypothetical protein
VLIAQALGEYGGAGVLGGLATAAGSAVSWVQTSLTYDRPQWIGAAIVVLVVFWLFRKR